MANQVRVPQGYTEQSSDIVGFWDSDEGPPIHFIPRSCRMFDSKIDPKKTSTLVVGELVDDLPVTTADDEEVLATKGQKVGVWTKPGMAALKELAGVPVYMYQDGEKDTGKPSPMKLFKVMSKGRGAKLPLTGDYRKLSKPTAPARSEHPDMTSDDDIPF